MGQSTEELTHDIESTRQNLSRDIDELSDKVSPGKVVHRQKQAAVNRLSSLRDQVMGTASHAGDAMSGTASDAAGSVQDAAQGAVRTAQGNPLAAGLAAFGVGLVVSSLIPASRKEAELAKQAVDVAKEQGAPVLQEGAQHLKEAAADAAEDLKGTAQEAAAHVQDEAASSAQTVKDDATSSAQAVKDEVGNA